MRIVKLHSSVYMYRVMGYNRLLPVDINTLFGKLIIQFACTKHIVYIAYSL